MAARSEDSEGLVRIQGDFNAVPLSRSIRQEVLFFEPDIMVMELIDNSIDATLHRSEPHITIEVNLVPEPGGSELIFSDNGRGMDLNTLKNYFRLAWTTSRIPPLPRDEHPGVLPLQHFINPKLNRYGRGCAACLYFGNYVSVETFRANVGHAYLCKYDYGAQESTTNYELEMYQRTQWHIADDEDEMDGWTEIKISQLLPERLQELESAEFWNGLAKKLSQVYAFFIHGFPEDLWNRLPPELTVGQHRPKGGLEIQIKVTDHRGEQPRVVFTGALSRDASTGSSGGGPRPQAFVSDLQAVLREFEEQCRANPLLQPCVTISRYLPPGLPVPGERHAPSSSGVVYASGRVDGGAGRGARRSYVQPPAGLTTPGPPPTLPRGGSGAAVAAGNGPHHQQLPQGSVVGSVADSRLDPEAAGEVTVLVGDSGTDIETRPKDAPCDFVTIWLYFPYSQGLRTKPKRDNGKELFVFPFWSGKDMVNSKLHGQYLDTHKAAVKMAMANQAVQAHKHKLEDTGRLVALVLVSPDALAHQHKSDFEGRAYRMFCEAGPAADPYVPSGPDQPRLFTYIWPAEPERRNGAGNAAPVIDLIGDTPVPAKAATPSRRTSTAATPLHPLYQLAMGGLATVSAAGAVAASGRGGGARTPGTGRGRGPGGGGGGYGGRDAPILADYCGWREDKERGWAAVQLLQAFATWRQLDEDGQLVDSTMGELTNDPGMAPPWGFDVVERGFVEYSQKYTYGPGWEPLQAGEMVVVGDATKIQQRRVSAAPTAAAAAGGAGAGPAPASGRGAGGAAATAVAAGSGGGAPGARSGVQRRPESARIVELFYIKGSDYARDLFAVARKWRPRWSPKPPALSICIMEVQPILKENKDGTQLKARLKEKEALAAKWEDTLPSRVVAVQETQEGSRIKLPAVELETNHAFDSLTLALAKPQPAAPASADGAQGKKIKLGRPPGGGKAAAAAAASGAAASGGGAGGGGGGDEDLLLDASKLMYFSTMDNAYRPVVKLVIEREAPAGGGSGDAGGTGVWDEVFSREQEEPDKGRWKFSGFKKYIKDPGRYRLRVLVSEGVVAEDAPAATAGGAAAAARDPSRPPAHPNVNALLLLDRSCDPANLYGDYFTALEHRFVVSAGLPGALTAFFASSPELEQALAAGETITSSMTREAALQRPPVVRLGEPVPVLAVQLQDRKGAKMAFSTDLMAKLRLPWDPATPPSAASGAGDGAAASPGGAPARRPHPLKITAAVVGGDPLTLPLQLRPPGSGGGSNSSRAQENQQQQGQQGAGPSQPRAAAAAGAVAAAPGSGGSAIRFSEDRMTMFVSGLCFTPVELQQNVAGPDGRLQKGVTVSEIKARLNISLKVRTTAAASNPASAKQPSAGATGAGAGGSSSPGTAAVALTVRLPDNAPGTEVRLVSGPPAGLEPEEALLLAHDSLENAIKLSKGTHPAKDLALRLLDAHGNPYFLQAGGPRAALPRVQLACCRVGPGGAEGPSPVMVRKPGVAAGSTTSRGAKSEFTELAEYEFDISGNLLTLRGSDLRAVGLPGDVGRLTITLMDQGAPPLPAGQSAAALAAAARRAAAAADAAAQKAGCTSLELLARRKAPGGVRSFSVYVHIPEVVLGVEVAEDEEGAEQDADADVEADAAAGEAGPSSNGVEAPAAVGSKRKATPTPSSAATGGPARKAARKGTASSRSSASGSRPQELGRSAGRRRANAHVHEYTLDGTDTARSALRELLRKVLKLQRLDALTPLSWEQLQLPAPGGDDDDDDECTQKSLLDEAFERRLRYTCAGPQEVWLRPSGTLLLTRDAVLAAMNVALSPPPLPSAAAMAAATLPSAGPRVAGGGVTYEQVFVLRPGQLELGGLRLSLSDAEDDVVNELLSVSVRVFIGNRDAFKGGAVPLTVKSGRVDLMDLAFEPGDFAGPYRTAAVHVCDADSVSAVLRGSSVKGNARAAAAAAVSKAYRYGTFYVRQEPHPWELRLAPIDCPILTNHRAELLQSPPAAGTSSQSSMPAPVEGTLRLPASTPAGAAGAAASAEEERQPQLLELVCGSGTAAAARQRQGGSSQPERKHDAAVLLASGLSLARQRVSIRAGDALQVPLVVVDQHGMPLRVSPELAAQLEAHTRAELVPRAEAAASANAQAAGSAPAGAIPCHVHWSWGCAVEAQEEQAQEQQDAAGDQAQQQEQRQEAEGGPRRSSRSAASTSRSQPQAQQQAPQQQPKPLPPLPHFTAQVHLPQVQGAHALRLEFDAAAAAAAAGVAGAGAGPSTAPARPAPEPASGSTATMRPATLVFALDVTHGKLAPAGYRLGLSAPDGVQPEALEAHPAGRSESDMALLPAPECDRIFRVEVAEQTDLVLSVQLQDAQGCLVAEDGGFTLQHVHAGQLQEAPLTVRGGVLTLQLPVGAGPMWLSPPVATPDEAAGGEGGGGPATVGRLLVLRPTSDNFKHAQPLCIYLHVRAGRYPVEPLRLLSVGGRSGGDLLQLRLALSNSDPPPLDADANAPNADADEAALVPAAGAWPGLPGFKLQVLSADGVKFEAEELKDLKLHWERQADGVSERWEEVEDAPSAELMPRPSGVFAARRGGVPLPTRAGHWRLMAVYRDERVLSPTRQLQPVQVLQVHVAPAPPTAIQLSPQSEAALGSGAGRQQCRLLSWAELQQGAPVLPAMSGCLVDRWGNHSVPPPCSQPGAFAPTLRRILLIAYERPADSAAGGSVPAEVPMYHVAACEVCGQEGTFQLPAVSLAGQPLRMGWDYELYLQLADEQEPDRPGEVCELVRTLYVCSVADSAQLYEDVARLEAEISSAQAEVAACSANLRGAEYATGGAAQDLAEQRHRLAAALGRPLPPPEQLEAEVEAADAEAASVAAAAGAGAGNGQPPPAQQQPLRRLVAHEQAVAAAVSHLAEQEAELGRFFEPGTLVRYQSQQRYPHPQQQQQPQSLCLSPVLSRVGPNGAVDEAATRQYQRVRCIADATFGVPGALGPLVMLGAAERSDVSDALAYLSRGSLDKLYVVGRSALDTVKSQLRELGAGSALDLCNGSLERFYELDPGAVDMSHPQMPLFKREMRDRYRDVLNFDVPRSALEGRSRPQDAREPDDHGFIGFAVNLVHLPPHLADVRVPTSRGQATLRQTLLNRVFGHAMVFDTEANVTAFQRRCSERGLRIETPVIAVDGRGGLNLGGIGEEQFGRRTRMSIGYSGLPPELVTPLALAPAAAGQPQQHLRGGALDLRLRTEQVRTAMMGNRRAQLQALATEVSDALQRLRVRRGMEAARRQELAALQLEAQPRLEALQQELAAAQAELERVRQRERQQQPQAGAGGGAGGTGPLERRRSGGDESNGNGAGGGAGGQGRDQVRYGRRPTARQPRLEHAQQGAAGGGARKRAAVELGGKSVKRPR
ncbi:hypothetical protein HYH02_001335 [Chlamydomonas schloesseri]|uniref:Uncharacterized protein n=1 Tax=Chlamydomonas schloesseri TaxID=2026947 RepID=A0A835WXB0_9CHLO|nr:hypothetical protein HYH02_001335 [Chlamydomonas schloesseri]|eukprot:KAG2454306.1 hypothetical protein HYH02_001335 [Chlamydomonas schloesseri]